MSRDRTSREFFEKKYRGGADPWGFASSSYELRRYGAILAALSGRRYARALEPGCSIGVLTAGLAGLCDQVEASDISPSAVEQARTRCASLKNVHLTCGSLEDAVPGGEFDLIVLSEIGYYFEEAQLAEIAEGLRGRLVRGGTLLAAHWLGRSQDHVLSGDRVHEVLTRLTGMQWELAERYEGFRLDRWSKT
jgi:SAM-dependent methyltransferase